MKILLVDDDELYCQLINKSLGKNGHAVTVVHDGEEAVAKARQDSFDLIITDIFMPNKEGLEVIQEIRDIQPAIKIIAISAGGAAGFTSFLKIAEAFGADASLQKPFSPDQLLQKINGLPADGKLQQGRS